MPSDALDPSAIPPDLESVIAVGFYGKLPIRGDFVQRNLPRSFTDHWDDWLQQALVSSREQLGEQWLRNYLTSPVWRFALSAGLCGDQAVAGVLIPSVDRVGRYFPLTIAAILPASTEPITLVEQADAWFVQVESLILQGLEDNLDFEQFADQVSQLALPKLDRAKVATVATSKQNWYCPLDQTALPEVRAALTPLLLRCVFDNYSVWWTQGSEQIAPCLLVCCGLPVVQGYAALLAGRWQERDWWVVPLSAATTKTDDPLGEL